MLIVSWPNAAHKIVIPRLIHAVVNILIIIILVCSAGFVSYFIFVLLLFEND